MLMQPHNAILDWNSQKHLVKIWYDTIGQVNEYLTMHYFGNPRHTQLIIVYKILTEYFW